MRMVQPYISLFFSLILIGCGGKYTLHDNLYCITPIENSESFHAIRVIDTMRTGHGSRNEFVRIDPNGTLNLITLLDSSVSPKPAAFVNDNTLLYDSYRSHSIRLYNLNTHKQLDILKGYEVEAISRDGKHFVARDAYARDQLKKSYRIEGDSIVEVGSMTPENQIYFVFGDSGYCFVDGTQFEPEDVSPETLDIVGPNLIPISKFPVFLTYNPYYNFTVDAEKSEMLFVCHLRPSKDDNKLVVRYSLSTRRLDTLFRGMYFTRAFGLSYPNLYLLNGKTAEDLIEERKELWEYWDELEKKGATIFNTPPTGYWLIANSKTQKMKKIGFEDWWPTMSSTGKSILFTRRNSDTDDFSIKIVSLEDYMPDD